MIKFTVNSGLATLYCTKCNNREVKSTMIAIKPPHLAEFKDAASEDRGWLLATSPHDPTRRYPFSRCTAGRSVIHPRARRTLMICWGSGSKPTRNEPRIRAPDL
ncbi:hypothetical protein T11_16597 [Trichinella zimbabwensis]|uniref:Uncharacterized protein n=1 Tax=Trichinella zimbabwensis TaxID=268475 RepID=A0A0V1GYB9_9BILA|nr:hypothetical protein T11_16597 [Trichinella zimbabwensis]